MNKFTLLLIACNLFNVCTAQQKIEKVKFNWKKPEKRVEIPAEFANDDVVIINNELLYSNFYDYGSRFEPYCTRFLRRKFRILTKDGLEENSQLRIQVTRADEILFLDVRTIKPDGKTFEIKSEDIIKQKTYDDETDQTYNEYRIALPNLEVGDDVEFVYSVGIRRIVTYDEIILHQEYPTIKSTFLYKVKQGLITGLFWTNGMVEPIKNTDGTIDTYYWKMELLPGLKNQYYAIQNRELPTITINVKKIQIQGMSQAQPIGAISWSDLYKETESWLYDNGKNKGLDAYFESQSGNLTGKSKLEIVQYYNQLINENFKLVSRIDDDDKTKPLTYFIGKKTIDWSNLYLFYKYLLIHYNVPFHYCYSKSKYSGTLVLQVVTDNQITHYFFQFNDGQDHFLFVSNENRKYYVDERPYQLENAKVIELTKKTLDESEDPLLGIFNISELPADANNRQLTLHIKLNEAKDSLLIDGKIKYSGYVTNINRNSWEEIVKDFKEEDVADRFFWDKDDHIKFSNAEIILNEKKYPFPLEIKFSAAQKTELSQVDPTTESLNLKNYFQHSTFLSSDRPRILNLYLPFKKNDEVVIFFENDKPIEVINKTEFETKISNLLGTYSMSMTTVNERTVKLTSTYIIQNTYTEKDKYKFLLELNEAANKGLASNLLFRTK